MGTKSCTGKADFIGMIMVFVKLLFMDMPFCFRPVLRLLRNVLRRISGSVIGNGFKYHKTWFIFPNA